MIAAQTDSMALQYSINFVTPSLKNPRFRIVFTEKLPKSFSHRQAICLWLKLTAFSSKTFRTKNSRRIGWEMALCSELIWKLIYQNKRTYRIPTMSNGRFDVRPWPEALTFLMFRGHIRNIVIVNYGEQQCQEGLFSRFSCDCARVMVRIKVTLRTFY